MIGLITETWVRFILGWCMFFMTVEDNEMDLNIHCWEDHSGCWIEDHNLGESSPRYFYFTYPNGDDQEVDITE